jgi:hypothetical protein
MSDSYDTGDTGHDYASGHETFGQEQDHTESFAGFAEAHVHEHDAQYTHVHHVEYDDGHGGHYVEDDFVVYSEHEVDVDVSSGEQYAESDHALSFADEAFSEEHLRELLSGEWLTGPGESDGGQATDGLSHVSN